MVVNKIWSYGDSNSKVEVYDVDARTMRFKISNLKAREKVIKRGMWNIVDVPMVVKKWSPKAEEEKQEEETIPMWVHLRKIPLSTFSWEALSFMTSIVGHPVCLHPETIACSNFDEAKVFVKVDITKALSKEIDFTWGSKEFTAAFHYPWLPSRCNLCEKWGHTDMVCGMKRREKKPEENGNKEESPTAKVMKIVGELEKSIAVHERSVQIMEVGTSRKEVSEVKKADVVESSGQDSELRKGNGWSLVSPDKIGRAHSTPVETSVVQISASKFSVLSIDVEEGEITGNQEDDGIENEETEAVSILEGDVFEDEILDQMGIEKDKAVMQKGGRRVQRAKAQQVQPKSKRSSRRNL